LYFNENEDDNDHQKNKSEPAKSPIKEENKSLFYQNNAPNYLRESN
jgi:hypothetical protein